jgi:hypothetical protein
MEFVYLFSSATTGSCRDQFARCSSISSQVSIITNNLVPRNCVWWQRPNVSWTPKMRQLVKVEPCP